LKNFGKLNFGKFKMKKQTKCKSCKAVLSPQEKAAYNGVCELCWIGKFPTTSHPVVTKVKKVRKSGIKEF
jgi:hypothetical protein